uniref:3-hydroxy-3-methylglutaryl coenzyme A reductase n=1 Tax=Centruroides hentzi TaxID=88313 RepID=A0A2I9LPJ5_9SCOR
MLFHIFYSHGHMCASHPWEVILAFITVTISMLFMDGAVFNHHKMDWNCKASMMQEEKGIEVISLTITRCMALLYIYHQFRNLYKLGSKYLIGIAGLFTVFSSFVFSSSVVNFFRGNFAELSEALPVFLLLIDFSKAGLLTQFALSSVSQAEVQENIAQGMAILGPTITLDTIVETLVIGVGTLSGVKRLEEMCCFACLSAVVNYIVFMTFFPACLSLVLELSRDRQESRPVWHLSSLTKVLQQEEEQKPNPVLQRVKVIMSAGLVIVHAHSRWTVTIDTGAGFESPSSLSTSSGKDGNSFQDLSSWCFFFYRWLSVSPEQMVMIIIAGALAVKYVFFENHELLEHLSSSAVTSSNRNIRNQNNQTMFSINDYPSKLEYQPFSPVRKVSWPLTKQEYQGRNPYISSSPSYLSHLYASRSLSFTLDDSNETVITHFKIDKEVQTEENSNLNKIENMNNQVSEPRTLEECLRLLDLKTDIQNFTDEELLILLKNKKLSLHKLENDLGNCERAVVVRRKFISKLVNCEDALNELPFTNYNYEMVMGVCCENVIGYMPLPVGIAGPLLLDGKNYYIPMATTEGCLVASTNRGCRAISLSGGVRSNVTGDGMTRGPVVRLPSVQQAVTVMNWLNEEENFKYLKSVFDSTSRFAKLKRLHVRVAGHYVFIRFIATTGDAMGMNMLSKGTEVSLQKLQNKFPEMEILSISGNYCTDKKPAAINWIEGRGKSVVCEAEIPGKVVKEVLKTTAQAMIDVNNGKNLVGSAMAGSIGGFNAQASNIVTAVYIATGQDPAQNVGSSNCITLMECRGPQGENLHVSCTMPSIEIGTVGGGTNLPPQAACLSLLGVRGPCRENPGENAAVLARIVCATVLAGELSLVSALGAGHLVKSHLTYNRPPTGKEKWPDCGGKA